MNVLEIRLLGAPTVHWGGAPLSIVRRQTRMLLFRLAMFGQPCCASASASSFGLMSPKL